MAITVESAAAGPISANTYVITDSQSGETAVIDAGGFTPEIKSLIDGKNVKYILLTHGHFDHILGVYDIKEYTNAKVAVHKYDAGCLESEDESLCSWECAGQQRLMKADIMIFDGDVLNLGETKIKVMHTPGHTRGGVCYIIEDERLIFSGDTLFCLTAGRTDFPGGSDEDMMSSLIRLKNLSGDYKVYPGHNRPTTLQFERTHNRYMRSLTAQI